MESYYKVNTIVMKLIHQGDELFDWLDDELKYYKTSAEKRYDCLVTMAPGSKKIIIPDKAVLSFADDENRRKYVFKDSVYLYKNAEFLVSVDRLNEKITVDYYKPTKEIYSYLRSMVKWGFIKSAEAKKLVYAHAAAVNYKGKNIIFSGDMQSGKSSSTIRLLRAGATLITDDSMIVDEGSIIPFTFKATVDKNLAERFGIKADFLDIGEHMNRNKKYKRVDIIIFPHIWNSDKSEEKEISYEQALFKMMRIYQKEVALNAIYNWDKNMAKKSELVFNRYSKIIKNTKFVEFYAGYDEKEVEKSLIKCIEKRL